MLKNETYSSNPAAVSFVFRMTIYSNSRLNKFEECPRAYKLKYIEKVEVERRQNVYGFLGTIVHETLEKFHNELEKNLKRSLKGVVKLFSKLWSEKWNKKIQVSHPNYTPEHFKETGKRCVENYYEKHKPFDKEKTLGTELRVHPTIKADGEEYKFQGVIDRLAKDKNGRYIIHDYKTSKNLPTMKDLKNNRQLPLYQVGVQQKYADSDSVRSVWHYLRFGKTFEINFGKEDLNTVRNGIVDLLQEIEKAEENKNFPTRRDEGANCNWCDYQEICPEWTNYDETGKSGPNLTQNSLEHYL